MSITLYESEEASDGTKGPFELPFLIGDRGERLVSIFINGTATVSVQGVLDLGSNEWIDVIIGKTASELIPISYVPWLRVVVSGVVGTPTVAVRVSSQ